MGLQATPESFEQQMQNPNMMTQSATEAFEQTNPNAVVQAVPEAFGQPMQNSNIVIQPAPQTIEQQVQDTTVVAQVIPESFGQPAEPNVMVQAVPVAVAQQEPVVDTAPVAGVSLEQAQDTSSVTFDYNELYNARTDTSATQSQAEQESSWGMEETPILFDDVEHQISQRDIVTDVIPAFDANALEDLPEEFRKNNPNDPLILSMAKEAQQEKDQHKRNWIFIGVFFAILVFAVLVIFPMLVNSGI